MLQIKSISKRYKTGDFVQQALDKVSLNLRDSEFVADSGSLGLRQDHLAQHHRRPRPVRRRRPASSTASPRSEYKDRDWDAYRNHTIGFVFQSYNLIPHQTILANVELALTLSGVSARPSAASARVEALEKVGLGEQHQQEAEPAVRRPDAARGHRPRTGQRPGHRAGRRADRRARLRDSPCRS